MTVVDLRWFAGLSATDWLHATVRSLDNPPPAYIVFDVDLTVLAVTVAATLLSAVASGLLPAWLSSRADTNAVLRDGGRGSTSRSVTLISDALGRTVKARVSANALRTVDHRGGLDAFLLKAKDADLAPKMLDLKRAIVKKQGKAAPAAASK